MQLASGPQDMARYNALSKHDRDMLQFEKTFLESVVGRRPEWPDAVRTLAGIYTELGFYHDGLALDERACSLLPDDDGAHYDLACSRALTGNLDGAFQALQKACALGYSDKLHMAKDQDLKNLHQDFRFAEILHHMQSVQDK